LVKVLRPESYRYQQPLAALGAPEHFALPSVTFLAAYQAWIIRNAEGFYALKAVCPHLGCKPDWKPETQGFHCPCHGSRFASDGALLEGPSLKPLDRLPLRLEKNQLFLVLQPSDRENTFIHYPQKQRRS
jgi:Rieske Fe-S protein